MEVKLSEQFPRLSERVEPEEFSRRVSSKLGNAVGEVEIKFGNIIAPVERERFLDAMTMLKTDPELACNYFTFLSAIDWQAEGFEMLTMVFSTFHLNTVVVKTKLDKTDAKMPSLTDVYQGANWHERECAEMFGIDFEGHPKLDKLFLPPDFEGHPLLKDFKLASRTYKPWPGAKDPGEAESGGR